MVLFGSKLVETIHAQEEALVNYPVVIVMLISL